MISPSSPLLVCAGTGALLAFFASAAVLFFSVRQRRLRHLIPGIPMFLVSVFLHQCTVMTVYQNARSRAGLAAVGWFSALPPAVPVLAAGTVLAWSMLTLRALRRGEERRITPMSVKEAMDSLSAGVCAYLPGGRILLMNRAMERFCLEEVGSLPVSGEALARQLEQRL